MAKDERGKFFYCGLSTIELRPLAFELGDLVT